MKLDGKSYREIAEAVGSSVNSCRVLFHKRLRVTSRLLAADIDDVEALPHG